MILKMLTNLSKKGYQVIFNKNLNKIDFDLAKKYECHFIYFNKKLIKVEY